MSNFRNLALAGAFVLTSTAAFATSPTATPSTAPAAPAVTTTQSQPATPARPATAAPAATPTAPAVTAPAAGQTRKINVNTATVAELDALPQIDQTQANQIVANRPYRSLEDLVTKRVLSESLLGQVRDRLAIN